MDAAPIDIDTAYANYAKEPSQENLHSTVEALTPTIHYALASLNSIQDPLIKSKALLTAADAIKQYDPSRGASLPTFVTGHLRQLTRAVRQNKNPITIPERTQLDRYKLEQARKELTDKNNRDPDTLELADYTGLPLSRIEKIQTGSRAVPTEGEGDQFSYSEPDFEKEALEYVYHDADHTDRKILDMRVGFAGHPVLEPQEVAKKLNLTPSQLSRRAAKLALKIQKLHAALTSMQ